MGGLPKRVLSHEVDSEACKLVDRSFDKEWEIRELTGHDFGIDKMVEYFEDNVATGKTLLLQIKGTKDAIDEGAPRFQMPVKTLRYSELFTTPFLLIYASLKDQSCYYLWLQEYIRVILNYDKPSWKTQKTVSVRFPQTNKLSHPDTKRKLLYISQLPSQKDNWIDFYLSLDGLSYDIDALCHYYSADSFDDDMLGERTRKFFDQMILLEQRIKESYKVFQNFTFISFDDCYFGKLLDLIAVINKAEQLPRHKEFIELIRFSQLVNSHAIGIAQHYGISYRRFLYECDGASVF